MSRISYLSLVVALGLALSAGCSAKKGSETGAPTRNDELQQVAGMLRDFQAATNRGPTSAGELARFQGEYPFGSKAVQSGDVLVVWGAQIAGEGGGGSDGVIAYEKKAPTEGGWVLLANGQVKEMSAAQFGSAPKATK